MPSILTHQGHWSCNFIRGMALKRLPVSAPLRRVSSLPPPRVQPTPTPNVPLTAQQKTMFARCTSHHMRFRCVSHNNHSQMEMLLITPDQMGKGFVFNPTMRDDVGLGRTGD